MVAFWGFMFIMDLLIPITMIFYGWMFQRKAPHDINSFFGYRTAMSSINKETWIYAHKVCGKLWFYAGTIMVVPTVIVFIVLFGSSIDQIGQVGGILCGIQLILLVGPILPTEIALRKRFDKMGNIKEK